MTPSIYLGCPQWQHPDWSRWLPPGSTPLERYSRVFNAVEGNTTFYATPSQTQCRQWRRQVPDDFRFLLKFPRSITHDRLLANTGDEVRAFLDIISPLHDVLGPFLLQLPAAFGPAHLDRLWGFLDDLPPPLTCTVEVRNPDFFAKGEAERTLNRGLRERNVARLCFDSRALFAASPDNDATRDAQRKKPQLPVHVLPVEAPPVIRFIGHPELEANRTFLKPWVERVGTWIDQGQCPFVFMHMPDNGDALHLAALWTQMLSKRVPQVEPIHMGEHQPQIGLF